MNGIMTPSSKHEGELLQSLRKTFGPTTGAARTLEERLQSLTEQQLQTVMRTAQMVKMASSFQYSPTETYLQLVNSMYPRLGWDIRNLIAELLQDADPIFVDAKTDDTSSDNAVKSTVIQEYQEPLNSHNNRGDTIGETTNTPSTDTSQNGFLKRMAQSESSGRSDAEITIKDGRTFTGLYQFGDARLTDYRKATGEEFTTQQFKDDEQLQQKVAQWHFNDIDKAIDSLGDAAKGYDRDGLRAVAHLSGIGGMKKYVRTKGTYNPSDELGTSAQDYYNKFSSHGGV